MYHPRKIPAHRSPHNQYPRCWENVLRSHSNPLRTSRTPPPSRLNIRIPPLTFSPPSRSPHRIHTRYQSTPLHRPTKLHPSLQELLYTAPRLRYCTSQNPLLFPWLQHRKSSPFLPSKSHPHAPHRSTHCSFTRLRSLHTSQHILFPRRRARRFSLRRRGSRRSFFSQHFREGIG